MRSNSTHEFARSLRLARVLGVQALLLSVLPAFSVVADTPLTAVRVVNGLSNPVWVGHVPDDANRLFVLEQIGRVRIVKDGLLLPIPFLDLDAADLVRCCGERGLLGLAFHPNYTSNGAFFVYYTRMPDGAIVVVRYTVSNDPDLANTNADVLLTIPHSTFSNHNGGWMAFGPDGYLYLGIGDGGDHNDPSNRAQDITNELLGKMLRIDVDGDDFPEDAARNYAIPPDNPFVGIDGDDEIWAYGLRNPWRNSFDPATGDLYIADVGEQLWEELNVQSPSSAGGENYGWRCKEGLHCNPAYDCSCDLGAFVDPVFEYAHGGSPFRCSMTGGEVYRGCAVPDLAGAYFYADYCSFQIWSLRFDGAVVTDVRDRTAELAPGNGLSIRGVSSFGRDSLGELYLCDRAGGEIFKIVPATPAPGSIVASDPPDGAIDARQPIEVDGFTPAGWRFVELTFANANPPCMGPESFVVTREGGSGPIPNVAGVEVLDSDRLRVVLDRPIPVGAWTRITHVDSGESVRIGFLPGDVNLTRTTAPSDLVDLIDSANEVGGVRPIASTDIDRNGKLDAADVARMIELLDGSGPFGSYLGATLP